MALRKNRIILLIWLMHYSLQSNHLQKGREIELMYFMQLTSKPDALFIQHGTNTVWKAHAWKVRGIQYKNRISQ